MSNAIKFTAREVTLNISSDQANNAMIFKVTDTGIGIPVGNRVSSKLSAGRWFNQEVGGTGLDFPSAESWLSIGGEIEVTSVENTGSTFTLFYL
ncbi:hypothetical protein CS542_03950 [Pedobacter sp. IW39]|nr:hypothetical protein CS542_03950 [Pedobacter sp. IW39]